MSTLSTANKPAQMTIAFILNPIASPTPPNKMSLSFLLSPHTISVHKSLLDDAMSLSNKGRRSDGYASASTSTVFSTPELAIFPKLAQSPKPTQICSLPVSSATRISLPSFAELVHSISSWSPPPSAPESEPAFRTLGPTRLYGTTALGIEEFDHDHDLRQEEAEDADDELSDGDTYASDNETDWNSNNSDSDGTSDCPREDDYAQLEAWLDDWLEDEEESDLEGFKSEGKIEDECWRMEGDNFHPPSF